MNEKEILDEFDKLFIIPAMINTKRPASTIYGGAVNYQLKSFISKALSDQRETFLNQPANEHDQEVRNQLRKEIAREVEERKIGGTQDWKGAFNDGLNVAIRIIQK